MFRKILIDLKAVIDLPIPYYYRIRNKEKQAEALELEAKDLTDFIRDHRSRDHYHIYIEREYESRCEFCGYMEERDIDGSPVCCGKAQEEWIKQIGSLKNG